VITITRHLDRRVETVAVEDLHKALAEGAGVVWIDVAGEEREDYDVLCAMGLSGLVVEDMMDDAAAPKTERHDGYLFTVVHGLDLEAGGRDDFQLETIELDAALGSGWLVTHAHRRLDLVTTVHERLARGGAGAETPAALLHELLDVMVDQYAPFIDTFIPARMDAIEDELFADHPSSLARREIYLRRRDVIRLARVAQPQADALRALSVASQEAGAESDARLFGDIADRLDRISAATAALRDELDSAFQHYHSQVAASQNEITKVLALASTVLLPLTVITGVYGMNFQYMPELDERWGYPFALSLCALVLIINVLVFRAKGWIGGKEARAARARARLRPEDLQLRILDRTVRLPALGDREVVGPTDRPTDRPIDPLGASLAPEPSER